MVCAETLSVRWDLLRMFPLAFSRSKESPLCHICLASKVKTCQESKNTIQIDRIILRTKTPRCEGSCMHDPWCAAQSKQLLPCIPPSRLRAQVLSLTCLLYHIKVKKSVSRRKTPGLSVFCLSFFLSFFLSFLLNSKLNYLRIAYAFEAIILPFCHPTVFYGNIIFLSTWIKLTVNVNSCHQSD